MISAAIQRVRRHGVTSMLSYSLGRFATVRSAYGSGVGAAQQAGAIPGMRAVGTQTLFAEHSAERVAADIDRQSVAFGLRLPESIVQALEHTARTSRLRDWGTLREVPADGVVDGRLSDGSPVFTADVVDIDLCPAAIRVARDPLLLDAIALHFGYRPIGVEMRMLRSFVVDAPVSERRKFQTVDYHFDVHGYNFTYANFYITSVDVHSGAHEMVLGSHRDKPVRWLFGSARREDAEIVEHYGADRIRTIEGPAGLGFVQDSSCYHRVIAPTRRERIMLNLRYF